MSSFVNFGPNNWELRYILEILKFLSISKFFDARAAAALKKVPAEFLKPIKELGKYTKKERIATNVSMFKRTSDPKEILI